MLFSMKKLSSFFKYEDPENISGLTFPVPEDKLLAVKSCSYIPNRERTEAYDLKRMKFFIEHPDEIKDIVFECDGESIVINDGNHRYMAALYLGFKYVEGELIGFQEILPEIAYEVEEGKSSNCSFKGNDVK